jgi:hypothetical protein
MIVDGVVVDRALAAVVLRLLGEAIRRDPSADSAELRRLRVDLEDLAAARTTSGRSVDAEERPWLSCTEAAAKLHRSERSLRRDAAADRIEARKERGRWLIRI